MLQGAPPFCGATTLATYDKIRTEALVLPPELAASPAGDLLRRMLEKEPEKRATLAEVRASDFVVQHCGPPPEALPGLPS